MIYLDNAGTTKMFPECAEVHQHFSCEEFFNPSTPTLAGAQVFKKISEVEKEIVSKLGAKEGHVLFTGCATESNNLAIKGSLRSGDWEYVFSEGEHSSVFEVAKHLQREGKVVHFVPLLPDGTCDLDQLERVVNEKTRLISVIFVSNETGAINDIKRISQIKLKKCPRAILHVDAVQAFMKIPFSLRETAVDLLSFSGHKIHAPKGVAGLYVKNLSGLKPLFEGGGQQYGMRSGTENVSGIMQLGRAIELLDVETNLQHTQNLKERFVASLQGGGVKVHDFGGSPYILNVVFPGLKGETMLHALDERGVIIGLGSACGSKTAGNRVLECLGLSKSEILSSARISFNAYMTDQEVEQAGKIVAETFDDLRKRMGLG